MSTALATIEKGGAMSLPETMQLADVFWKSGLFSDCRSQAQAAVKILAGMEMGFSPVASITGVHVIEGKPSLGSHLLAAAIKRSGRYDYKVIKLDDAECVLEFFSIEPNTNGGFTRTSLGMEKFTMAEAQAKGLDAANTGKGIKVGERWVKNNWHKAPRNMLFARCISNGYKFFCPDLSGGMVAYVPDEIGSDETPTTHMDVIDVKPEPPPVQQPAPEFITPEQVAQLTDLLRDAGADVKAFLAHYAVVPAVLPKFPAVHFQDAVDKLQKKIARKINGQPAVAPIQQVARIMALLEELKITSDTASKQIKDKYGTDSLASLTEAQADELESVLEKMRQKKKPAA